MRRLECEAIQDEIIAILQEKHGNYVRLEPARASRDEWFWFCVTNWGVKATNVRAKVGINLVDLRIQCTSEIIPCLTYQLHELEQVIARLEKSLRLPV